jgi:hypothetical protein
MTNRYRLKILEFSFLRGNHLFRMDGLLVCLTDDGKLSACLFLRQRFAGCCLYTRQTSTISSQICPIAVAADDCHQISYKDLHLLVYRRSNWVFV